MNPHVQRARMLVSQSRFELAEQELRQALTQEPNNAEVHSILAICLCEREQYEEAKDEADHAIHLAPDQPFPYYVNALVLYQCNRFGEAQEAMDVAVELDPFEADFFALRSQIYYARKNWKDTLAAAEEGLELDPENIDCANLKAMALVKLGNRESAGDAVAAALMRDPENAITHANQGWTLIEKGDYKKAMEHFREALRIQPEMEWARQGILEAMRAKYFLYRIVLGFFLWMSKFTSRSQWLVLIGMYLGFRFLSRLASNNPQWSVWIMPVLVLYVAFALMTWLAGPLFNLVLRLNRFGRLALSREEIVTANWVGLCVLGALTCLGFYFGNGDPSALIGALACVFVIPPLSRIYDCVSGQPRIACIMITVGMATIGFFASVPLMASPLINDLPAVARVPIERAALVCLQLFAFAAIGTQFAVNALVMSRPKK